MGGDSDQQLPIDRPPEGAEEGLSDDHSPEKRPKPETEARIRAIAERHRETLEYLADR
jgi:hypothetical protein